MLSPIISNWLFTSIVGLELGMSYNVTHNLILPSAVSISYSVFKNMILLNGMGSLAHA